VYAAASKGIPGDAKCVTEILGDKNKEVGGQSLPFTSYLFVLRENKRVKPITENLGDRYNEVGGGGGATQFFLDIAQFYFHFSRVDILLCEHDTAVQNSTAVPQNKTSSYQNV